jgi:hypothetical protein
LLVGGLLLGGLLEGGAGLDGGGELEEVEVDVLEEAEEDVGVGEADGLLE